MKHLRLFLSGLSLQVSGLLFAQVSIPASRITGAFTSEQLDTLVPADAFSIAKIDGLQPALDAETDARTAGGKKVSVLSYGAVGDGTADDTDEIQAAITAAGEGGSIELPGGYVFKTTYTIILSAGQTLHGAGTLQYEPGDDSSAIANQGFTTATGYTAASNITIRDITLNAPTGNGISFGNGSGYRVIGVRSYAVYHHQVDFGGVRDSSVVGSVVENSITTNINGGAIQIDNSNAANGIRTSGGTIVPQSSDATGSRDIVISGCVIKNPQSFGIQLHRGPHQGVSITHNVTHDTYVGIYLGDASYSYTNISAVGNQCYNNGRWGIGGGGTHDGITVSDNIVDGSGGTLSGPGIQLNPAASSRAVMSGNVVKNHAHQGIYLANFTGAQVVNNRIGPSLGASASYAGIQLMDCAQVVVSANNLDGGDSTNVLAGVYATLSAGSVISDLAITGNVIRNYRRGIEVRGNALRVSAVGNVITKVMKFGILIGVESDGAWTGIVDRANVANNTISDIGDGTNGWGVMVSNARLSSVTGNVIQKPNNQTSGANGAGIELRLTGTVAAGSYNTVSGNLIDGGTASPNQTVQNGILIATSRTIVTENRVLNCKNQLNSTGSPTDLYVYGNKVEGTSPLAETSITSLGTITTGTWTATPIGSSYGGAGAVSGVLKANGSGVVSAAVAGTDYANLPLTATATLDFPEIAAGASADLTITVSGAVVGYSVSHGLPAAPTAGITWGSFVSAADTVTIRATNVTASPVDPASATYRATVFVP